MATEMPEWIAEQALQPLYLDNLTRPRLITATAPKPFQVTPDIAEGDLIDVIQPDGQRDTYRIAGGEPTAVGFGVSFTMERAEGR